MAWKQISFITSSALAESLSDLLHENGAVSVTLKESGEDKIYEPDIGTTPLWRQTGVDALFEEDVSIEAVIDLLKQNFNSNEFPEFKVTDVEDKEWERVWLDEFKPMQFGEQLWIIPSAYEPVDSEAINIYLDPGLAFGTGTHATTASCLRWIDKYKANVDCVIDYGCGSGVLAIAAAKMGAKEVHAVDIDPQALDATLANAIKNSVENKIKVYLPDQFKVKAADLLLANILANPLMDLAESFADMTRQGGTIVLSGILREQAQSVLEKYQSHFTMNEPEYQDDWVLLSGIKA